MNDNDNLALAELLCARLCHDLAGAVGAVGTGAELLAEEGDAEGIGGEALDLLAISAAAAVNRLRFLRLALGRGGADMPPADLHAVVSGFLSSPGAGGEKLRLDWGDAGTDPWPGEAAKLLLNLVLLARDCLPRGGVVSIRPGAPDKALATVAAEGPRAAPGEAAMALTAGRAAGLGPREVQGYYAAQLAECLGLTIHYNDGQDRVVFVAGKD